MKNIIVGAGEVGKSLYRVLKDHHETHIRDIGPAVVNGTIEVLNICFPYDWQTKGEKFIAAVKEYQEEYKPKITIIHSTVDVGTSRFLGAVHSPIHGKHPNLDKGIRTFVKYIGAEDPLDADYADEFLRKAGINTMIVPTPEDSEASKLWCTTQYGWNIALMKKIKQYCDERGLDFNTVYGWNQFYNEGYRKLGMHQFIRPMLEHMPGGIGGHCVINNCHILESEIAKIILNFNDEFTEENTVL